MTQTATLADTIELVEPRLPALIERAAARAVAEVPGYAELPQEDVASGIRRDLQLAMVSLLERRELRDDDREAMGIIGRTRAQQGLPLEAMLQVYWITVDEVFGELWELAESGQLDMRDGFALAGSAWRLVGPVIEVAVRAYHTEQLELAVADSHRLSGLVLGLLETPTDGNSHEVAALGLDPTERYVAFRARRSDADSRRLMLDLKLPGVLTGGLAAQLEDDVVGIAQRAPSPAETSGMIVAVGPSGRIHDLPHSFAVACRTIETATAFGREGVFGSGDLALESLARADHALGDALVDRYITPLSPESENGREMLRTLRALLDSDMSTDRAAAALFVHPNTVRNRIRRFENVTGQSLASITTCTELHIALLRYSADY